MEISVMFDAQIKEIEEVIGVGKTSYSHQLRDFIIKNGYIMSFNKIVIKIPMTFF